MEEYPKLEYTDTSRIYNLGKEYGFSMITAFEKPSRTAIPYKVKKIMEFTQRDGQTLYEKLKNSGFMFLEICGIYKETYEAYSFFVINKIKKHWNGADDYEEKVLPKQIPDLSITPMFYPGFQKIFYNTEKKDTIKLINPRAVESEKELPLPETLTDLVKLFYDAFDDGFKDVGKDPGVFSYYLKVFQTIPGRHGQERNTGTTIYTNEYPKTWEGWM